MNREDIGTALLRSAEPSIRWKVRVHVRGERPDAPAIRPLQRAIRRSRRVRDRLSGVDTRDRVNGMRDPYTKWQGAHWVLAALADLGYPGRDRSLFALRDQVLDRWLGDTYYEEHDASSAAEAYRKGGGPRMQGRDRRCAAQQGNALDFLTRLGLTNPRSDARGQRLLHWEWPDGGWNCDRNPGANTSSFWESRHAMLGLAVHGERTGDSAATPAAARASEVVLGRHLVLER